MIQKSYTAKTLTEAISAIKREMGSRAVILSTRKYLAKKGLFSKGVPMLEVVAGVDENHLSVDQLDALKKSPAADKIPLEAAQEPKATEPRREDVQVNVSEAARGRMLAERLRKLEEENKELRERVEYLLRSPRKAEAAVLTDSAPAREKPFVPASSAAPSAQTTVAVPPSETAMTRRHVLDMSEFLLQNGVSDKICNDWQEKLLASGRVFSKEEVLEEAANHLIGLVDVYRGVLPRIMGFIGPDGCGKTTMILKLAYHLRKRGKKVVIVTMDNRKTDSLERMKAYAEELAVPFCVMHHNHTWELRLRSYDDCDHVLIDTPSLKADDEVGIRKVCRKLSQSGSFNLAVFPACEDYPRLLEAYKEFNVTGIVFTKLDQLFRAGPLFNLAAQAKKPLYYYGIGENLTEDLEPATAERLISMLFHIDIEDEGLESDHGDDARV